MSIKVKTKKDIGIMHEGGKKLSGIKKILKEKIKEGVNAKEIEDLATKLIKKEGGTPSFKTVPKYSWSTCINVGSGVVHGVPKKEIVFKNGDLVSVDIGFYYKGFHTDSSFSLIVGSSESEFLKVGKKALEAGISKAKVGGRIYDISEAIEKTLKKGGYSPVKVLVGHGIGKNLHEAPQIPCFTKEKREKSQKILEGSVLAIEVMYTEEESDMYLEEDGWTISTKNESLAGLFEETVAILGSGPKILT